MKGKLWKKGLSALTSIVMLAGAVPMQLFPEIGNRVGIAASADSYGSKTVSIGYANYPGNNGNYNEYIPFDVSKKYGYSEQLYMANEVGDLAEINAISFEIIQPASNQNLEIYLADTTSNTMYNGPLDVSLQCVYSGTMNFNGNGTKTVVFQNSFTHDPSKNLLLMINNKSGQLSTLRMATFERDASTLTYTRASDDGPIQPVLHDKSGYTLSYRTIIKLYGDTAPQEKVTIGLDGDSSYDGFADKSLPFTEDYPYSYSEQIYLSEEIGNIRKIGALSLNVTRTSPGMKGRIYLADTTKVSPSKWTGKSNATLVYDGEFPFDKYGEAVIQLQTTFTHDTGQNLLVIFDNTTGSNSTLKCSTFQRPDEEDWVTLAATSSSTTPDNYPGDGATAGHQFGVRNILTLYSTDAKHYIGYHSNNGNNYTSSETIYPNQRVKIMQNYFMNTGYEFTCWNTKADGTGTVYNVGQKITAGEEGLSLYAQWRKLTDAKDIGEMQGYEYFNGSLPIFPYYNYGFSEQIYTAEEIGDAGTISALSFAVAQPMDMLLTFSLYLMDTDLTSFNNAVPLTNATKVFTGTMNFNQPLWSKITFDTPFVHDGSKNLMVILVNETGEYDYSPALRFVTYQGENDCVVSDYGDDDYLAPGDTSDPGFADYKNCIRIWCSNPNQSKIGTVSENAYNPYFPIYSFYQYGYSEQIYTANEVGDIGMISSVGFSVAKPQDFEMTCALYLADTTKYFFENRSDYIPLSEASKVYEGPVNFDHAGWNTINLDTSFVHDPQKNLAVIMVNKTGTFDEMVQFHTYTPSTSYKSSIYDYTSDKYIEPAGAKENGYAEYVKSCIQLSGRGEYKEIGIPSYTHESSPMFSNFLGEYPCWSEQFYSADEVGDPGVISSLGINVKDAKNESCELKLYLADIEGTLSSDISEKIMDQAVRVFDGSIAMSKTGWIDIPFDTLYYHDPQQNLVVIAVCEDKQYSSNSYETSSLYSYDTDVETEYDYGRTPGIYYDHGDMPIESSCRYKLQIRLRSSDAKTASITYKANSGTGADVVQKHVSGGEAFLKSEKIFTKEGYVMTGWNAKADGSGNSYTFGERISWKNDVTLYAQWKKAATITYKKNDGSADEVVIAHAAGMPTKLGDIFGRSDYVFMSWNTKADGSGNTYQAGQEVSWNDNVTLYAQWKPRRIISYYPNCYQPIWYEDEIYEQNQFHAAGEPVKLMAPKFTIVDAGFIFSGWNTKADGSGNTYWPGQVVSWYDDVRLYAIWKRERKIIYHANDGTDVTDIQLHGAGVPTELHPADTFTNDSAFFFCWNSKADGSGNNYQPGQEVTWLADVELYAVWRASRTITYKANGGSGSDVVQKHGRGMAAALKPASTFTRSGYSLTGWNTKADGSGNSYAPGKEVSWNDNVTLYAQWKKTATITYKANGESQADVVQTHGAGEKVALKPANTFTSSNAFFAGWNSKADGSGNTYQAGQEVTWTSNVTLYAMWRASRTITYKANGGTGSDVVQKHGRGLLATLKPANTFSRSGYTFTGWNSKADGSGSTYAAGQSVTWQDNVTLYAQWKKTVTITYKANGETQADVVQTHGAGEKIALKPANTFTSSNAFFAGWNSKADGTGNTYQPGQEVTWTSNVTLYAMWRASRTITYKPNGAGGADVVQKHGRGMAVTLKPATTFTYSGYIFTGWNTKADGSGSTYAAGQSVTWQDNVTLYAQWKKTVTITYKANGGTGADVVQNHGAGIRTALKPASTFTRSGYTLAGWNSKADGSGNTYAPGQEVTWTSNVTLYAVWKENRTITYKANGGTGADVVQYHGAGVKTALKSASTFTRSGYTFAGWNSKADGSGNTYAAGQEVTWNDNVTLYAKWTKK